MEKRIESEFLKKVKQSLMLTEDDTFADDELLLHIDACTNLLITSGIKKEIAESDNSLVEGLIVIYCKTFYGFKSDGSVKELPQSFYILYHQLALTCGDDNVS